VSVPLVLPTTRSAVFDVATAVLVGRAVFVAVGTDVSVAVGCAVLVAVGCAVFVAVGTDVFVAVGCGVLVAVGCGVLVAVGCAVFVAVGCGVLVAVGTGVSVDVGVAVSVAVAGGVYVAVASSAHVTVAPTNVMPKSTALTSKRPVPTPWTPGRGTNAISLVPAAMHLNVVVSSGPVYVLAWNAQPTWTTGGATATWGATQNVPHGLAGASVTAVLSTGSGWITAGSKLSSMSYPAHSASLRGVNEASVSTAENVLPTGTEPVGTPAMLNVAPPAADVAVAGGGGVPQVTVAPTSVISKSMAF
jgi:hypothetical protein